MIRESIVVVDLGCMDFGSQDSVGSLIDEYRPRRLYGFDPHPQLDVAVTQRKGVPVRLYRKAAWLHDGEVGYREDGTRSTTGIGTTGVPCIDFSRWLGLRKLPTVVKMDVEGAEYDLLERMVVDGTDRSVAELVVEWHGDQEWADELTGRLACPVRRWWM